MTSGGRFAQDQTPPTMAREAEGTKRGLVGAYLIWIKKR
jgi:hypothetical protein